MRKAFELKEEYHVKQEKRDKSLANIYASLGTEESGVIEKKFEDLYAVKDTQKINKLGLQLFEEESSESNHCQEINNNKQNQISCHALPR
jgi:hypothetical protein